MSPAAGPGSARKWPRGSCATIRFHAGDIAQPATADALVRTAKEAFGGIDILINNAGVFRPKAFLDVNEHEYDWFLDTILKGKFFMAQAMRERGRARAHAQT